MTVIPLGHEGERKFYLKNIPQLGKILHVNDSTVLISNWKTDGSVEDWNYLLNTTETRLTKMKNPFYMTKIYTETGEVYVICEWGSNSIKVYDNQWKQIGNMGGKGRDDGQLDHPHAITGTERGTILVSDLVNSRICHFTLDGKFINTVLGPSDGINRPHGVAYRFPYLWVSPYELKDDLKCFQVNWA